MIYTKVMSKKIKITQTQLNVLMEQNISNEFHVDQQGDLQQGEMSTPEPYEMAEKVADFLINSEGPILHPEYMENDELYRDFVDALHDVLTKRMETGENHEREQSNPLDVTQAQFNESVEDFKKEFKRFL